MSRPVKPGQDFLLINIEGTYVCGFPASQKHEHPRSAHRRDRSMPGLDAVSTEAQVPAAHLALELLRICDDPVSMRDTFVVFS